MLGIYTCLATAIPFALFSLSLFRPALRAGPRFFRGTGWFVIASKHQFQKVLTGLLHLVIPAQAGIQ